MKGSLQLSQLLVEIRVVGHSFLDETNYALLIYEVGQPPAAIGVPEKFLVVRYQGKFDTIFLDEILDGVYIVVADPDNLCIELVKFFQVPLEISKFTRSD